MNSIGKKKAVDLAETNWWELCESREIAEFQLFTEELCRPFEVFHKAVEDSLGRSVWTHELGMNWEGITAEFLGEREPPSIDQIVNLIPEEKRLVIEIED